MTQRHVRDSSPHDVDRQPEMLVMDQAVARGLDERQRADRQRALRDGWVRLARLPAPKPRVAHDLAETRHADGLEAVAPRRRRGEHLLRHPLALAVAHGPHAFPRVRLLQYLGARRVEDGGNAGDEGEGWLGPEARPYGEIDEVVGRPDRPGFEALEAEVEVHRPGVVDDGRHCVEDPRVDRVAGGKATRWVR